MNFEVRKKVVSKLEHFEINYPVNKWVVESVDLWPIIKFYCTHKLYNTENVKDKNTNDIVYSFNKKSKFSTAIIAFRGFLSYFFSSFSKADIVASSVGNYKANWNNQVMHKYFDPLLDECEKQNIKGILISLNEENRTNYKTSRVKNISNWNYYLRIFNRNQKFNLNNLEGFKTFLNELSNELNTNSEYLEITLNQIFREVFLWKKVYKHLFRKVKPKFSISLCYYSWEFYGMNAAANEMHIISIDMQHGGIGAYHTAYKFNEIPKNGYSVLPRIFWTWDSLTKDFIDTWAKDSWHKTISGGNLWINFISNSNNKIEYQKDSKKVILLTLQNTLYPVLDDFIIKAIKNTDDNQFVWWLRYHPGMSKKEMDEVNEIIRYNEFSNKVITHLAAEIPLPIALMKCEVHLSKFSGSILEAALMNKLNIIIDELGKSAYANLIEDNKASFFDPNENLDLYDFILNQFDNVEKTNFSTYETKSLSLILAEIENECSTA
jgi:hypothetical protein